jgi:hypothetical protein
MKKVKEQSATILVSGKSAHRSAVIKALRFAFVLLSILIWALHSHAAPDKKSEKPKEAKDSVTVQADAIALSGLERSKIELTNNLKWSELYTNWQLASLNGHLPSCVSPTVDADQAYIFHIAHWADGGTGKPPKLISSAWSAYGSKWRNPDVLVRKLAANGDPLIYGKKRILLVGVNIFDDLKNGAGTLTIRYKSSVTQGTPENVQALGQLVSSVIGLSSAAKAAEGSILVAFVCQQSTAHLPFDLNVVETIGVPDSTGKDTDPKKQNPPNSPNTSSLSHRLAHGGQNTIKPASLTETRPRSPSDHTSSIERRTNDSAQQGSGSPTPAGGDNSSQDGSQKDSSNSPKAGQADCSALSAKNTCTISRKLTSVDKEWWDVSLAVPIPGVKESKYSISGSALQSKPTTHTDLYALFDIYYPWSNWATKDSIFPHITAGIPVAGQPFYRPEVGLAENLTGWTTLEKLGFPVRMSFFAGLVYMKTTTVQGSPTTAAELTTNSKSKRVWKPIFGVEVPVSSLISKIGSGSKNKNTNSGTTAGGKNGNQGSTVTN